MMEGEFHSVMVCIRQARPEDMVAIQWCKQHSSWPFHLSTKHYLAHLQAWPQLQFVAEDNNGKIVGCLLAKLGEPDVNVDGINDPEDEDWPPWCGRIISLSVLRTHFNLGVASKLLVAAMENLDAVFRAKLVFFRIPRKDDEGFLLMLLLVLGFDEDPYTTKEDETAYMVRELSRETLIKHTTKIGSVSVVSYASSRATS